MKLYQELSLLIQHLTLPGYNPLHTVQHNRLNELMRRYIAPLEANVQVEIVLSKSAKNHLVLNVRYNHEGDLADGKEESGTIDQETWTIHKVVIVPSFVATLDITVGGAKSHKAHIKVEDYLRKQLMLETILSQQQFNEIFGDN